MLSGKSNRERHILYFIHMSNLKKKTETDIDTENIYSAMHQLYLNRTGRKKYASKNNPHFGGKIKGFGCK